MDWEELTWDEYRELPEWSDCTENAAGPETGERLHQAVRNAARTVAGYQHLPPCAVAIPRLFKSLAIRLNV